MSGKSIFSEGSKIAVVEDEEIVSMMLEHILQNVGYHVDIFSAGESLLECIDDVCPDLILMDIRLDGQLDGIDTAKQVLMSHDIPVVFLTAHSDDKNLQRIIQISPYGYLTKPCREKELVCIIEVSMARNRLERSLRESEERYRTLFNNTSDFVYLYAMDESGNPGKFIEANAFTQHQLGYSSEELSVCSPWDIYDEDCHPDFSRMMQALQKNGDVCHELIHVAKDGTRSLVEVHAHQFMLDGRDVVLSICRQVNI